MAVLVDVRKGIAVNVTKRVASAVGTLLIAVSLAGGALPGPDRPQIAGPRMAAGESRPTFGRPPVGFEPNVGQTDPRVRFVARGAGYSLFLTRTDAVLAIHPAAPGPAGRFGARRPSPRQAQQPERSVRMRFVDASSSPWVEAGNRLPGVSNYFIGSDPNAWRTGVPQFGSVTYRGLYPGIDLTFMGTRDGGVEYHFTVAPGADPSRIQLAFSGQSSLASTAAGGLVLQLPGIRVTQPKPTTYQVISGARVTVRSGYLQLSGISFGFAVGRFDPTRPLVIDPEIAYSTYLGGSDFDLGAAVAVDRSGHAYVTGSTSSLDFPATPGVFQPSPAGGGDTFVTKLSEDGSALVYSTYLGGTSEDDPFGIAVDRFGNAYVTGFTFSHDFPTTPRAFQPTAPGGIDDAWVTKLDPTGASLAWSTYLGGSGHEAADTPKVDRAGNVYVLLDTGSTDFPVTQGAFQTTFAGGDCTILCDFGPFDAAVTKLKADGSGLIYSTYLGGTGDDAGLGFAIDRRGDAYLAVETTSADYPVTPGGYQTTFAGGDGLFGVNADNGITKLNPTGTALVYSTYLGASGDECIFFDCGLAVDRSGHAYVASSTDSTDFPTTPGAFQASNAGSVDVTITKLTRDGSALVYSTYLGGTGDDEPLFDVGLDRAGHAFISGDTSSTDFPTVHAFQSSFRGGATDATAVELGRKGLRLVYSSYFGGTGSDFGYGIVTDREGNAYMTGYSDSTELRTTNGAFQRTFGGVADGFVTKVESEDDTRPAVAHRGPATAPSGSFWRALRLRLSPRSMP